LTELKELWNRTAKRSCLRWSVIGQCRLRGVNGLPFNIAESLGMHQ